MGSTGVLELREKFMTPDFVLESLQNHSQILVDPPAGAGKTTMAKAIISDPRFQNAFTIVYLADTRAILNEFKEVRDYHISNQPDILVLERRPSSLCGVRAGDWLRLEKTGNSEYAKKHICPLCPNFMACTWRNQLKASNLKNRRIIFGVTDYLFDAPKMLTTAIEGNKDREVLVIIDEAGVVTRSLSKKLSITNIRNFLNIVKKVCGDLTNGLDDTQRNDLCEWEQLSRNLLHDPHHVASFKKLPYLSKEIATLVQEEGLHTNQNFEYLGGALQSMSECSSLRRFFCEESQSFEYLSDPKFHSAKVMIMAANLDEELVNLRLNTEGFKAIFPKCFPKHAHSRMTNIRSSAGSKYNFSKYGDNFLKISAHLICEQLNNDKRVLLISKKCFISQIKNTLPDLIEEISNRSVKIIDSNYALAKDSQGSLIPIINYGIVGVNAFEDYDVAICLNSYYLSPQVLHEKIYETIPETRGLQYSIEIKNGIRTVCPPSGCLRQNYFGRITNKLLYLFETSVVEQAVARVRYINNPRLVILSNRSTFSFPLDEDFPSVFDFRIALKIPSQRQSRFLERKTQALQLSATGLTVPEISSIIGVTTSSVYKYLSHELEVTP